MSIAPVGKDFLLYSTEILQSDIIDSLKISVMETVWIEII